MAESLSNPTATAALPTDPALSGPVVSLGGRIDIFPGLPLPEYGTAAAPAFAARPTGSMAASPATMVAIVAAARLPVRSDTFPTLLSYRSPSLMIYRDSGLVEWNAGGPNRRLMCLVYDKPPGGDNGPTRLSQYFATPQRPLDDEKTVVLLRPLINMLGDLQARGVGHGRLHPDNIFVGSAGIAAGLQVGDMASLPGSFDMPAYFLPIERAQAQPEARGAPHTYDDLFALGVLVLMLKLGGPSPAFQLPPDELMRLRLERGSYSTYLGEHGIKGATSDLLRGLLEDDSARRWNLDALETWLGGHKPTATGAVKVATEESKPRRPFTILIGNDQVSSQTRRGVAWLLTRAPLAAAAAVESGELLRWVERSIEVEALTARANRLLDVRAAAVGTRPATLPDHLTARASLLLDPAAPINYRGLSLMPGGFGTLLSSTMTNGGDVQPLADILNAGLPSLWTDGQNENRADHLSVSQALERAQVYLERPHPGFGIERVLYELVQGQPCLSPMIQHLAPRTVLELLHALDNVGASAGSTPIDRHVAAFLVARDRRIHEGLLTALRSAENSEELQIRRAIGTLTLLAESQYRHGQPPLKNLAAWLLKLLEPGVKRFHLKETQATLRQKLAAAAAQGDLSEMLSAIDDPATLDADIAGYNDARMIWQQAEEDIAVLQTDIDQRAEVEQRVGQPIAAALAVVLGIIAGAYAIVVSLWSAP